MDFFFLLQLLFRDRCQVGQAADFDFVAHVLGVTSGKHLDSLHKLVVHTDLVLEGASITIVQYINLIGLLLQVNFEVHCAVNSVLNLLFFVLNLLNLIILVC